MISAHLLVEGRPEHILWLFVKLSRLLCANLFLSAVRQTNPR